MKDSKLQKTDNRLILYPSIDATRSNYHGNKTVMKKPEFKPPKPETPKKKDIDSFSVASTMISENSADKKKRQGISIAPIPYSKLTDIELERVIRAEIRKNPYLINKKKP